jgi:hypothetical protein
MSHLLLRAFFRSRLLPDHHNALRRVWSMREPWSSWLSARAQRGLVEWARGVLRGAASDR